MTRVLELMNERNSLLLIIDVQEKLIKAILNKDHIIFNIKKLIEVTRILNMDILFSEQNPEKLGNTLNELSNEYQDKIFSKKKFSCANFHKLNEVLESHPIKNILLCGIETHVCIQQTALELKSKGYNIFICVDAVGSRNPIDHNIALKRLEYSGAILSTTESSIFELCGTSDREEFRLISSVIKQKI
tara:strand:+ start:61036 stop:61599 length:564 start_codon:yes stop_codon:yes gene_type:complete